MEGACSVGIVGTFDVENFGDLLFPIIAEGELARRNPSITLEAFSLNERRPPDWPYQVTSVSDLADKLPSLNALLIGGGQIVRFDDGYPINYPMTLKPSLDYWLRPAAAAQIHGIPVIWNAPGAWTASPLPEKGVELLRQVLSSQYTMYVRDNASYDHIKSIVPSASVKVLPDTAFGLSRLFSFPSRNSFSGSKTDSKIFDLRYAVVQADPRLLKYHDLIMDILGKAGIRTVVLTEICKCHGDNVSAIDGFHDLAIIKKPWGHPLATVELIAGASLVFSSSLHGCITALSYGVPAVLIPSFNVEDRKFEQLSAFAGLAKIDDLSSVTRALAMEDAKDPHIVQCQDRLRNYWDEVVEVIRIAKPNLDGR